MGRVEQSRLGSSTMPTAVFHREATPGNGTDRQPRFLSRSIENRELPRQIVVAVFHEQSLAVGRKPPAIAEMHRARSKLKPRFNYQFIVLPTCAPANVFTIQEISTLLAVGSAREDNSLFTSIGPREDQLFLQFGIGVLDLYPKSFRRRPRESAPRQICIPRTSEIGAHRPL